MKPVNILVWVLAGAIAGAVVMKVAERPRHTVSAPQNSAPAKTLAQAPAQMPAAPPAPAVQTTSEPDAGTALPPAEKKPSPVEPLLTPRKAAPSHTHSSKPPAETASASAAPRSAEHEPVQIAQSAPAPAPVPTPAPPQAADRPAPQEIPPAHPEVEHATSPPPPAEEPHSVTLNAGMPISVRLVDGLSSQRNAPGDAFTATLDHELAADGFVIAERGARVEGRVVTVDRGSKVHGGATLEIELTHVRTSDGQIVRIQTETFTKRSEPDRGADAAKVAGGAAIGAIIGAIAGGGKGAAIGAGAGGGAGAGDVLLTRKPATLPSETRITFRLKEPVRVTEQRG